MGAIEQHANRGAMRLPMLLDEICRSQAEIEANRAGTSEDAKAAAAVTSSLARQLAAEAIREYDGLHASFQYRLSDHLDLGGNWTWSDASGNFDGETAVSGPVTGAGQRLDQSRGAAGCR